MKFVIEHQGKLLHEFYCDDSIKIPEVEIFVIVQTYPEKLLSKKKKYIRDVPCMKILTKEKSSVQRP